MLWGSTPWCNDSCRNSRRARSLFGVSVLWSAPSSSRYRGVRYNHWVQPRGVRYNHWVQPRVATTRVVIRGRPAPCAELACCGRRRPRVAIVVPTPWCNDSCRNSRTARTLRRVSVLRPAPSSSRDRGSNRGFSRLGWSAEPTLLSLSWYKPGVRLPPRAANVVQTRGETLGGKPVDVSISMG